MSPAAEQRFPLLAGARWLIPVALTLGVLGIASAPSRTGRLVFGGGSFVIAGLWALARRRRPILIVDDNGYRVVEATREVLRVGWDEIRGARAVPAELAMYLDCGDPSRNLLLPTRHGYGFRFARQSDLYVLLARKLDQRLRIVDTLIPPAATAPPAGP